MRQFNISSNLKNHCFCFDTYDRAQYRGEWKSYEHMHSFAEIFFVVDGKGVFHTKTEDVPVQKGTIIIVNPTVVHTEISSEDEPLEYAVFSIANMTFSSEEAGDYIPFFVFDLVSHFDFLFDVIRIIEDEEYQRRPLWQTAILTKFNDFMLFLLRKTKLYSLPFDSSEKVNAMSQIHLYLRASYQEEITLEKLAKHFFLNKYYIAHAYKKKYGVSIMQQLNVIRCQEARKLLETTNLTIAEIAISVGFNSISHFSGTYKNITGESPAKTRKTFYENKITLD